ncbi:hypothetical protein B0H14DRAFT_274991 [Mycena olivaceomarginata]|nr:hypothetical protein B0H14DRAFT_274991 [Mycena olivaceomarginata]
MAVCRRSRTDRRPSALLVVATSMSPRLLLPATRLRIVVGLHLARHPPQGSSTPLPLLHRASSPPSTRCSRHSLRPPSTGFDFTSAARIGVLTSMRARARREQWTMRVEDASNLGGRGTCGWEVDGKRTGKEQVYPRASYRGIDTSVRIDLSLFLSS